MPEPLPSDLTSDLQRLVEHDPSERGLASRWMPLVYDQLRALAAKWLGQEHEGHTLQATALVNEAYVKLVDQSRVDWKCKSHFFAIGATVMRRILVDHARGKNRQKRGGGWTKIPLDDVPSLCVDDIENVLAVDDALKKLESVDGLQLKIVEMRFFAGMTVAEVAEVLGLSKRKVELEWQMVRAWLRRELGEGERP